MTGIKFVVGIDTGVTGKIAVLDLSQIEDVENRISVYETPSDDRYVSPVGLTELFESLFSDNAVFFMEKSGTGQRVQGLHTAAMNCGITYAVCSLYGMTDVVPSVTWQAQMRRYAELNGWENMLSNRASKDLPSLVAHAFAPQFTDKVEGKGIYVDDNISDAICIALYGAISTKVIENIFISG